MNDLPSCYCSLVLRAVDQVVMDEKAGDASKCTSCQALISAVNVKSKDVESHVRSKGMDRDEPTDDPLLKEAVTMVKETYDKSSNT